MEILVPILQWLNVYQKQLKIIELLTTTCKIKMYQRTVSTQKVATLSVSESTGENGSPIKKKSK